MGFANQQQAQQYLSSLAFKPNNGETFEAYRDRAQAAGTSMPGAADDYYDALRMVGTTTPVEADAFPHQDPAVGTWTPNQTDYRSGVIPEEHLLMGAKNIEIPQEERAIPGSVKNNTKKVTSPEGRARYEARKAQGEILTPDQVSDIDYTLRPGETTEAYHQRIAQARGESYDGGQTQVVNQGNIDYTLHPGESIQQYNARIATARGETAGGLGTGGTGSFTDSGFADVKTGKGTSSGSGGGQAPSTFISLYKDIIKELGLTDIKKEFKKTVEEHAKLQEKLSDEIAEVNDNPWLSEGVRVKEIQKLQDKYETKLAILTNKQQIYDSLYKEGVQQAQYLATGEYNAQADAAALAEKRYEAQLKLLEVDPANFKEVQGGLYDIQAQAWIVPPSAGGGGSNPTSFKEWELAGGLSGTGQSYAQWIGGGAGGTGGGGTGGQPVGVNGKPIKLSAGQQDDVATMDTVVALANKVLGFGEDLPGVGGLGAGSLSQFLAKNFGVGGSEGQDIRNYIGNIQGTIAKLRGGTSFTPNEQKLLETYSPTINDSDVVITSKLNGLIDFIGIKKQNLLNVAGGNYTGSGQDDPLGLF